MPIDDTESFEIQVNQSQIFPVFHGVSIPATVTLFQGNKLANIDYDDLVNWGCNSVYFRLYWGGGSTSIGFEPDEYAVGQPDSANEPGYPSIPGCGYSTQIYNDVLTQVNLAKQHNLFVFIGLQNSYMQTCANSSSAWSDYYSGNFINMNTQPNNCSTGVQTPIPGRQRWLNLLRFVCRMFNPADVGIIPWDYPYHADSDTLTEAGKTQYYAQPNGTQALMLQAIRSADDYYWPNKNHPRYVALSPISQGGGIDSQNYLTGTGALEVDQPVYNDPYIWYGYNSHISGNNPQHTWQPPSRWGYIVGIVANPATGLVTYWDENMSNYNAQWRGLEQFKINHPTAKVISWEWIGLNIHQWDSTGAGIPHEGLRPLSLAEQPSRMNWAANHFMKARNTNSSYMFFDWWGHRPGKPLTTNSPTEGGGLYEKDINGNSANKTSGQPNDMLHMLRYYNTIDAGTYTWSDGTQHTLPQTFNQIGIVYTNKVPPWMWE